MRHVGEQPTALDGVLFEPPRHLVEGPRQPADLASPVLGHANRVVAGLDSACRLNEVTYRRRRATDAGTQQQGHEDRQDGQ